MKLNPVEIEEGKDLAERLLCRKLTKDEETVFVFAAGYGGGTADSKRRGIKRVRNPFNQRNGA